MWWLRFVTRIEGMQRIAAVFLAALALATPAVAAKNAPLAPPSANAVIAYWTPERIEAAQPRDYVFDVGSTRARLSIVDERALVRSTPRPTATPRPENIATTTGSSWKQAGLALTVTGKVFFTMGGSNYVCSGAVVTDTRTDYSLVLTAGHCAYDQELKQFATNWLFIPAYDSTPTTQCQDALYGCWTAQALVVHSGFASESGLTTAAATRDWAFAIVGAGGNQSRQLDAQVGSFQMSINSVSVNSKVAAFGYPAASPYSGEDLVYCAGKIFEDTYSSNLTWGLPCKMTGGASGGAWVTGYSSARGFVTSVNSYKYSGEEYMFGPKFDNAMQLTLTTADSVLVNSITP